jgi:hypothetical protein
MTTLTTIVKYRALLHCVALALSSNVLYIVTVSGSIVF